PVAGDVHGAHRPGANARAAPARRLGDDWRAADPDGGHARQATAREAGQRPRSDRDRPRPRLSHVRSCGEVMALFGRKLTLAEAVDRIRAELRAGTLPGEVVEELRRRDQPVVSGGREPPGLQEMLEAVPGAAALLEVGGRMVARNAGMTRLLGRAATVLEATRSAELQDVCARALAGWPQRRELSLPALDLQVEAHVAPLTHARALLVLRDLTAERRADRVRRDFIANASHELRTPVTAIRAAAETLLDGGLELPDQAREFVRMISRHAARLSRLTDDLLDLSRLETGDWKPQTGPVQLAPLSDAVLELFRDAAGEKEIVLSADVPERLRANADR